MAKLKFKDENNEFIPVVQDVKVNNSSVFDGKDADIKLKTINNQSIVGTGNIDIQGGEGEYVKYTPNQNLTTQQKLNARNNINSFGRDEVKQQLGASTTDVISQKGVTDEINKKQDAKPDGRNNLIANDTGKLNVKYLPATVLGGITYGGTFNDRGYIAASSYAPELDGEDIRDVSYGTYPSFYFIYSGPEIASFFGVDYAVGDMALSTLNGWAHLNSTDAVTSVNGKVGSVIINADDIGAVLNHWGIDNRNKNLVTDAFGTVTVSDFALGQILVDNYLELPNVNPEAPHQDIPENARATVAHTMDVYPSFTVEEFEDALTEGEPLDKTVVIFDPDAENRPTLGAYTSLSNDDYTFYVGYDDSSTYDASYRVEVGNNNTGDYFEMIYSFKEQVYINDESITLNPNVWTKIATDPNTGDYVATETDHNDIPNLANPYVSDMYEVDSAFMIPIKWDKTYFNGDYMYVQETPYTDPPTFYWKYTPSNVQSNWNETDSGSLAYILNKPLLRTNISSGLATSAGEEITGTLKLHKISKTGNYADLRNQVGKVDETNGGEIFNMYTGQDANIANLYAVAFGSGNKSSGSTSFTANSYNTASGSSSFAIGHSTTASNNAAFSSGQFTTASGNSSFVTGAYNTASGNFSFACNYFVEASGVGAMAEGLYTKASSDYQHVQGKYNIVDNSSAYAHIVGNGTATNARSNAHTLDWSGNAWYKGDIKVGGSNYSTGSTFVEKQSNKVTSISSSSTDTQYPSAKCVYDIVGDIESLLQGV